MTQLSAQAARMNSVYTQKYTPQNFSNNATLSLLRGFEPMAGYDWHSLATLARTANEVVVPAKRLLVRPPRRLSGVWYLCAGAVRNEQTGERFLAGSRRCRWPIYPGQASLRCISAVRLLYFDADAVRSFRLQRQDEDMPNSAGLIAVEDPVSDSATGSWLETLAASPVLRLLYLRRGASGWQRWLRELKQLMVAPAEQLIAPGTVGECFYVVQSGVALVEEAGCPEPLARIAAGGFFGEDAVLTGQPCGARVHMPLGGSVLRGDAAQLHELVSDLWWALARQPESWSSDCEHLCIPSVLHPQALRRRIDGLEKTVPYGLCVTQNSGLLNLALLLLVHRGYRVLLCQRCQGDEGAGAP